jgi:hypothetical protein
MSVATAAPDPRIRGCVAEAEELLAEAREELSAEWLEGPGKDLRDLDVWLAEREAERG